MAIELFDKDEISLIAQRIRAKGLRIPAILFLEMHKPLTRIVAESITISMPMLKLVMSHISAEKAQLFFSEPRHIELLIQELERA